MRQENWIPLLRRIALAALIVLGLVFMFSGVYFWFLSFMISNLGRPLTVHEQTLQNFYLATSYVLILISPVILYFHFRATRQLPSAAEQTLIKCRRELVNNEAIINAYALSAPTQDSGAAPDQRIE